MTHAITVTLAVIGFINIACMCVFAGLIWANERAGRRQDEHRDAATARQVGGWR